MGSDRYLLLEEVPIEDISDGPREYLVLKVPKSEPVLLSCPVARHVLHFVRHAVELVLVGVAHLAAAGRKGGAELPS